MYPGIDGFLGFKRGRVVPIKILQKSSLTFQSFEKSKNQTLYTKVIIESQPSLTDWQLSHSVEHRNLTIV